METSLSKPIIQVKIITWLSRKNSLLTTFMEGAVVTNAKMLSVGHVMFAGYCLLRSLSFGYTAMGICVLWFILSTLLCLCCKVK